MSVAIYPGSFDPITNGHLSIVEGGLVSFDTLIVAVAHNPKKQPMFTVEERVQMIRDSVGGNPRIEVDAFEGLLVDYAKRRGVSTILRGLRAVADFEYELQMANMNRELNEKIVTVFIMAKDAYFYVSSQLIREAARLGGDVSRLVPPPVLPKLKAKLGT